MQHQLRFATGLAAFAFVAACADNPAAPTALSPLDGSLAAKPAGGSGTTLSATISASGFREDRLEYDWTVKTTLRGIMAGPHMVEEPLTGQTTVTPGDPRWLEYRVEATRNDATRYSAAGVRGSVCVTNAGSVATERLSIIDVVQTKTGSGAFEDLVTAPLDVSAKPTLAPGEAYCYPYDIRVASAAGAQLRNTARVTITNHSGFLGQAYGPGYGSDGVKADFAFPQNGTAVVRDASATIEEQFSGSCRSMFPSVYCSWAEATGPMLPTKLTASKTFDFVVDFYNYAACGEQFPFTGGVALTEDGPRAPGEAPQIRRDANTLLVKTGECGPKPADVGCTLTVGYWKNHEWPSGFRYTWDNAPAFNFFDTGITWKGILSVQPKGDAYYILAHQYIATRLNQLIGHSYISPELAKTLQSAHDYFSLSPDARAQFDRATLIQWADQLDRYNNGKLGVPHCS